MTAMRSPSWTTSPSATASLVTLPGLSASTGISIFIDSRITRVSPSATVSPSAATTFHTLATISARTSLTPTPSSSLSVSPQPAGCQSRAQPADQRRVVVAAGKFGRFEQVRVKLQVGLQPADPEFRDGRPRPLEHLLPVAAMEAQLSQ